MLCKACKHNNNSGKSGLQEILNVAGLAAKSCGQGTVTTEGANQKGKILLECAAVVHLMHNKGWKILLDQCVHGGGCGRETCCKTFLRRHLPQVEDHFLCHVCLCMLDTVVHVEWAKAIEGV